MAQSTISIYIKVMDYGILILASTRQSLYLQEWTLKEVM